MSGAVERKKKKTLTELRDQRYAIRYYNESNESTHPARIEVNKASNHIRKVIAGMVESSTYEISAEVNQRERIVPILLTLARTSGYGESSSSGSHSILKNDCC
jgi:hypothetical protein